VRTLDADDARPRGLTPLRSDERVSRAIDGHQSTTVSVLVSAFEKAGILKVEGRWVTVADRDRLKEASCECHDIIRKTHEAVGR